MAFKPNYNQARADRDRVKAQKKLAKQQKRDDDAAKRKGPSDEPQSPGAGEAPATDTNNS